MMTEIDAQQQACTCCLHSLSPTFLNQTKLVFEHKPNQSLTTVSSWKSHLFFNTVCNDSEKHRHMMSTSGEASDQKRLFFGGIIGGLLQS